MTDIHLSDERIQQIHECMGYLSELEQTDNAKFQKVMTVLEKEAKGKAQEQGINIEAIQAAYEQKLSTQINPLPTGVTLPGGLLELSKDGGGVRQKDDGISIVPKPGFVIKTLTQNANIDSNSCKKVFINVCSHDAVDEPGQKTKLDENGREVSGMNIPISVGPVRQCTDKKGKIAIAIDCIVHPEVIQRIHSDKTGYNRDFVCQLVIEYVQSKYNSIGKLEQRYKLPKIKYHAYINSETGEIVSSRHEKATVLHQQVRQRKAPTIQEIEPTKHNPKTIKNEYIAKKDELLRLRVDIGGILDDGTLISFQELCDEFKDDIIDIEESLPHRDSLKYPFLSDDIQIRHQHITKLQIETFFIQGSKSVPTVSISAWRLFIQAPGYQSSNYVLPFCVDVQSTICEFDQTNTSLKITVHVLQINMYEQPDIGSRAWKLAKGLTRQQTNRNKSNVDKYRRHHHQSVIQVESNDSVSSANSSPCVEDEALPEDLFHANDTFSRCILEQQRKERQEKAEMSKMSKSEGNDAEYIDVNDFKPGGKYYEPPKVSSLIDSTKHHQNTEKPILDLPEIRNVIGITLESNLYFELL